MILNKIIIYIYWIQCSGVDADPTEQFFRNVILSIKNVGEKFLSTIAIPNSRDFIFNPSVQFQMDEKTEYTIRSFNDFFNSCPYALPPPVMFGTWYLTHFSKRFMQTTMADIDEVINRLASGQLVNPRRTLISLFRSEVIFSCAQIIFLNDTTVTPFELSYSTVSGNKSIIGQMTKYFDRSMHMVFGPTTEMNSIITYSSILQSPSAVDVLVISQVDTFPKCDNYLVLQRSRENPTRIVEVLTALGANLPLNPLISIQCNPAMNK